MPFYRYSARDKSGKTYDGTISAKTQDEASFSLSQRGFQIVAIQDVRSAPVQAKPNPVPLAPPKVAAVATAPRPVATPAATPAQPTVTPNTVKTKPGSNRQLTFLFSQLSSLLRSGVTPHIGLAQLAKQTSHPGFRQSLEEMAQSATRGGAMSETMERYPYLYPPDVVGMVRAGELGGYLPDACLAVAQQTESTHKLAFRLTVFVTIAVCMLAVFPVSYGVVLGALETIRIQDQAGGSLPPVPTLLKELGKSLPRMIPPTLLGAAILIAAYIGWHTMPMRRMRHTLALYLPIFSGRTRAEAIARFSSSMERLSRAGLPPYLVFRSAAATVPNLILRERLMQQAEGMMEQEKLSDGVRRARVLPEEHEMILQNGEFIGDVPGALATIASEHETRYRGKEGQLAYKFGFILYPIIGLMVLGLTAVLYTTFYGGLIRLLTE